MSLSITVDRQGFKNATRVYLASPAGKKKLREFGFPSWVLIGLCAFQIVMGVLLLFTVIRFIQGVRHIFEGLTLKPLRDEKLQASKRIDELTPLICHGIYGNAQTGLGVVLGSFSPDADESLNAIIARDLGALYSDQSPNTNEQPMLRILQDDRYQPYRRRQLVEPFSTSSEAILFDVGVDFQDGIPTPLRTVMHAFVAINKEGGEIAQIPWSVANPFVRMRDQTKE